MKTKTLSAVRDFIIALNYAYKYGSCSPEDMPKAEKEFGDFANRKLGLISTDTEYGVVKDEPITHSSTIK